MAKRHRDLLARLEPVGLNRYQITEADVQMVEKYLSIIQRGFPGGSTWAEMIQIGGAYGTSILVHEVIEIRLLQTRGLQPLRQRTAALRDMVIRNIDTHVIATYEEHLYLQEVIDRRLSQHFEVATLIRANRGDDEDLELFLESEVGVYRLQEDRIDAAEQAIAQLKGEQQ